MVGHEDATRPVEMNTIPKQKCGDEDNENKYTKQLKLIDLFHIDTLPRPTPQHSVPIPSPT